MVYLLQTNDTTPGIHTLWPLRSSCVYALVAIVPACGACFGGTQVLFACPKAPRPADSWRRQWRSSTRKKGLKGGRRRKIKGRRGTTVPNPQERPGSLARANHAVPPCLRKGSRLRSAVGPPVAPAPLCTFSGRVFRSSYAVPGMRTFRHCILRPGFKTQKAIGLRCRTR